MDAAFWLERWRLGQIGFHQEDFNAHLCVYWPRLGLGGRGRVFVPLCGKSRDMLWLAGQGHSVVGVELSQKAVEEFFAENGLQPSITPHGRLTRYQSGEITLFWGDYFALTPDDLEGVVACYDRASLIALPPEMRGRYLAMLRYLLPQALPMLLISLEYDQSKAPGPPFCVAESEVMAHFGEQASLLARLDALAQFKAFQEKGVERLEELVFLVRQSALAEDYAAEGGGGWWRK